MGSVFIDSFSGSLGELKRGNRTQESALRALLADPRVSVWERGTPWLERLIADLKKDGLVDEMMTEPYPWCRFMVTQKGLDFLATKAKA